jgi:hypothetical protein
MERKVVRPEDPSWVRPVYDGGLSFGQNVRSATFGMSARDGRADVTTLARSGKLPDSRKLEAEHIDRPAPWVDDLMWRRRVGLEKKYTARTIQQARHGFPTARPGSATCIPGSARSSAAAPEDQLDALGFLKRKLSGHRTVQALAESLANSDTQAALLMQ